MPVARMDRCLFFALLSAPPSPAAKSRGTHLPVGAAFSSRSRHTSLQGDCSSDVCSSDLPAAPSSRKQKGSPCSELAASKSMIMNAPRSEERRVGEEGRSRGAPYHQKK